jgi:hypothetical protein
LCLEAAVAGLGSGGNAAPAPQAHEHSRFLTSHRRGYRKSRGERLAFLVELLAVVLVPLLVLALTYVFVLVAASAKSAELGLRGTSAGSSAPRVTQVTAAPKPADALAVTRGRPSPSAVLVGSYAGVWTVAIAAVLHVSRQVDLRCREAPCTEG